jgi:16S rRNA (adenine1518-N6/adenine1519-N6)-dimethyltransferase
MSRSALIAVLDRHDVGPRKRLGQHFLADPNICRRIVGLLESPTDVPIVEVGAGTGALTLALLDAGYSVRAYEVDERLRPVLEEVLGDRPGVDVRFGDATEIDFGAELEGPWAMAANLPYNVGTGIVLDMLRMAPQVEEMVIMVQREVADRLAASPGTKTYGVPSVIAQLHASVKLEFSVPPQVFVPPPNVGSAVVRLARHRSPSPASDRVADLAGAAFGQRRKMLRSSLASVVADPVALLEATGIRPDARAEQLEPTDYLRLAETEQRRG